MLSYNPEVWWTLVRISLVIYCGEITGSAPSLWIQHPSWTMTTPSILITWKPATDNTRGHRMSWAPCKTYHTHFLPGTSHLLMEVAYLGLFYRQQNGNFGEETDLQQWVTGTDFWVQALYHILLQCHLFKNQGIDRGCTQSIFLFFTFLKTFVDLFLSFFFFPAAPCGMQDLSSPTRELSSQNLCPCGESSDS